MKWLIIKTVLMLGIMIGGINYVSYLMTGKGMFDSVNLSMPSFDSFKTGLSNIEMPDLKAPSLGADREGAVTVYKWTDDNGTINYTQTLPDGIEGKTITVHPDTNLVQADPLPEPKSEEKENKKPETEEQIPSVSLLPNPQQVKDLMQNAEKVQQLMDDRTKAMEAAIQQSR